MIFIVKYVWLLFGLVNLILYLWIAFKEGLDSLRKEALYHGWTKAMLVYFGIQGINVAMAILLGPIYTVFLAII